MPEEEKKQYQILANELNSNAGQTIKPRPRVDIEADTNDFYKMQKYVKSLLDMISDKNGKNNLIYYITLFVCMFGFCVN